MPTVIIDFNIDDTRGSIEALLERLRRKAPGIGITEDVELDLRRCQFLGPSAVVTLIGLQAKATEHAHQLTLLPPAHPQLLNYCRYSGLLNAFSAGPPPDQHAANVTTPIRQFHTRPLSEIEEVARLVRLQMGMTSSDENRLTLTLIELAQNVIDHSQSVVGGFLSARAYSNEREVRFAVADMGVGFREALSKTHAISRDLDAVRLAMTPNVSSRSSSHNLGQGLKLLRDIILENGGSLLLLSKGAWYELRGAREHYGVLLSGNEYPGTMAAVRLPLRPATERDEEPHADIWG